MKARALQKRLGTTRTVHFSRGRVCIASAYIHDLISYSIESKHVRYALGDSPNDKEVNGLLNELKAMAESGEILQFIDGEDELEVRIPVYSCDDDGNIVESFTDKIGWPNVTADGIHMYDNEHFATTGEAVEKGIRNFEAGATMITVSIIEAERHLAERQALLNRYREAIQKLKQRKESK